MLQVLFSKERIISLYKKVFGYFLILFSLFSILIIGVPQFYSSNNSGRIDKEIDLKLNFLKNEKAEVVILYFGYVGCDTICVPSLSELDEIYKEIDKTKTSVYFINLLDIIEKDLPNLFASHFNKDFKGVYLDKSELLKVTKMLNVVYTKSFTNSYELNHAGYLYILQKDKENKSYKQKYIYTTRPFAKTIIVEDIKKLLNN